MTRPVTRRLAALLPGSWEEWAVVAFTLGALGALAAGAGQ